MTKSPGGWAWNADTRARPRGVFWPITCPLPSRVLTSSASEAPSSIPGGGWRKALISCLSGESQVGCGGLTGILTTQCGAQVLAGLQRPGEFERNKPNSWAPEDHMNLHGN